MNSERHFYEFGPFRLDAAERLLLREGRILPLTPKAFDVLLALVENSSHTVEKDDLMKRVWPDTCVEEVNLANNVSLLRKVLGEGSNADQYIQTVPRRGYRFVADVRVVSDASPDGETASSGPAFTQPREISDVQPARISAAATDGPQSSWWATNSRGRLAAIGASVLLIGLAAAGLYRFIGNGPRPDSERAPIKSVALLPFKPLVAGARDEMPEMGMAETLITRLSSIREITVRPMSAVRKYTALEQDAVAAGQEQQVDAVLEGTIQKVDDRIRVTARLLRIPDGRTLWAGKFEERFTNILDVQDAIAERASGVLALKLTSEERKLLAKRDTENPDAYQLYIRGRYFWNKRTPEGMKKAIECFQRAIDLDPNYAQAYVGLADSYAFSLWSGLPKEVWMNKQKAATAKALELDDTLAEAHATMAHIKDSIEDDYPGAEKEYNRSIELNSNYPTAHHWYSNFLNVQGRCDEALAEIRRAQELDPLSLIINATVGFALSCSGRTDEAIAQLRKTIEMDPNFMTTHRFLADAYITKKMYEEALAEFEKGIPIVQKQERLREVGYLYAVWGKRDKALKLCDGMKKLPDQDRWDHVDLAQVYAALGENDQAFEYLEKALQDRASLITPIRFDSRLANLRSDPRFADLIRRFQSKP